MTPSNRTTFALIAILIFGMAFTGCATRQTLGPVKQYKLVTVIRDGGPPTYLLRPVDETVPAVKQP
jgi:hypothetical protein